METDSIVGQVIAAVDATGEARNTLVLFTSDNGCAPYIDVAELESMGHYPSGPLRGYKSDVWEGGHRVPFIVRWPAVVEPDQTCDALVHQADLLATCAEVVDAPLPVSAGEDSHSLLPLLRGDHQPIRDTAISQSSQGLLALRKGPWKVIFGPGSGGWTKGNDEYPAQLYNLSEDLAETNNLYAQRTDVATDLTGTMERLVRDGRSTQGPPQQNDVAVDWKQFIIEGTPEE
jgi:arylsulfatase A-like enzyme